MKKNVTIQMEKGPGKGNFSCFMVDDMPDFGLAGYGRTAKEAMEDLFVADKEMKGLMTEKGKDYPELSFSFVFDVGSLFDYYSFLKIEGVAKITGISPTVMRQYASAKRNPSKKRLQQIQDGLRKLGKELQEIDLSPAY